MGLCSRVLPEEGRQVSGVFLLVHPSMPIAGPPKCPRMERPAVQRAVRCQTGEETSQKKGPRKGKSRRCRESEGENYLGIQSFLGIEGIYVPRF